MNQNVTQMNIVKASDPNNNSLFVTNSQQPQHIVTQTNKSISNALPSLNPQQQQQLNQYQVQMQQQNPIQSYNIRVCSINEALTIPPFFFLLSGSNNGSEQHEFFELHAPESDPTTTTTTTNDSTTSHQSFSTTAYRSSTKTIHSKTTCSTTPCT
jgi:hypothetical protein